MSELFKHFYLSYIEVNLKNLGKRKQKLEKITNYNLQTNHFIEK